MELSSNCLVAMSAEEQPVDRVFFADDQYALLDFGGGRKLERLGAYVLDRPAPAAADARRAAPQRWQEADLVLEQRGQVVGGNSDRIRGTGTAPWHMRCRELSLELRLTPFGHVGVFPEHAHNWQWLLRRLATADSESQERRKVLNLFAYTGILSLLAAADGCEVAHIDASAPTVAWARRNAQLSGLAEAPIRWIVEDVRKFVAREVRRGNRYSAVVLDPPTYGHGPKGTTWRIEEHLQDLLDACCQLLAEEQAWMVVTGHSQTPDEHAVAELLRGCTSLRSRKKSLTPGRQRLVDSHGRGLDMGWFVRVEVH
jgi:23S rRNA (cytosine1962-C5)-methyltransferase